MKSQATFLARLRYRFADIPEAVAFVSLLALFIFFSIAAGNFLTPISISNILTFASITGIVVIGVSILMIGGEFDLSVGSNFAVASYVFVLSLKAGMNPVLAMLAALLVSAGFGLINGLVVTGTGIPSFITTLGTMLAYRGIARAIGSGTFATYTGEPPALFGILNAPLDAINQLFNPSSTLRVSIFWFILIAIVMQVILRRTRYGNWIFATGGNPGAALSQGVPTRWVKVSAFVLVGLLTGFASITQLAYRLSVDPLRGVGMELIAVAACVIGGVRLNGGYGSVLGACVGMLLIQMLEQGLVLMHLPIEIFQAVTGLILIIAVISNTYLSGQK
jgi:simple sugar transport system permease protein